METALYVFAAIGALLLALAMNGKFSSLKLRRKKAETTSQKETPADVTTTTTKTTKKDGTVEEVTVTAPVVKKDDKKKDEKKKKPDWVTYVTVGGVLIAYFALSLYGIHQKYEPWKAFGAPGIAMGLILIGLWSLGGFTEIRQKWGWRILSAGAIFLALVIVSFIFQEGSAASGGNSAHQKIECPKHDPCITGALDATERTDVKEIPGGYDIRYDEISCIRMIDEHGNIVNPKTQKVRINKVWFVNICSTEDSPGTRYWFVEQPKQDMKLANQKPSKKKQNKKKKH